MLALVVAAVLARHHYLRAISAEGHRTELLAVALLILSYYAFVPRLGMAERVAGLSIGSAAAALASLATLVPTLPLLTWAIWRHRLRWRTLMVPLGFTGLYL